MIAEKIPIPKNLVVQGLTDQKNFRGENFDLTLASFWRMTNLFNNHLIQ